MDISSASTSAARTDSGHTENEADSCVSSASEATQLRRRAIEDALDIIDIQRVNGASGSLKSNPISKKPWGRGCGAVVIDDDESSETPVKLPGDADLMYDYYLVDSLSPKALADSTGTTFSPRGAAGGATDSSCPVVVISAVKLSGPA